VIEKDVKANIFLFWTLWYIELQGPFQPKLESITVWKLYFWNLRSIGFLSMPHSSIKRQFLDIKSKFFRLCDRKGRESEHFSVLNLMIYWISRPLAAKTRTCHGLKIIFLESTVNRLSVDASFLHKKTVVGPKKKVFRSYDRKGRES
jgi:hypothetical protein